MVPSILGDQTAQHGHYKSGGDGVEGEAEISGRWQEKVKLDEVNLILTALGESRLIPQWQSWARSTEDQSLRTERQNKVECRACICQGLPHMYMMFMRFIWGKHLLFTSKWKSSHNTSLKHSHQKSNEKEHLPLLHRREPKP